MKLSFIKAKKRDIIITLVAALVCVVLLGGNMVLAYFTPPKSIYFDMTDEGLYTLTDTMVKECSFVEKLGDDKKVKIIFASDPDVLISSESTRLVYFMALQLQDLYENIEVETINETLNPTAFAPYKPTSLSVIKSSDVIVAYGERYRITSAEKFWTTGSDGKYWSFNGEYRMATLLRSVTAVGMPKAYFLTDHGETYYDAQNPTSEMSLKAESFASLLAECGLEINTLEISKVDKIPSDCVLLIINNPTKDFATDPSQYDRLDYISDTEKIERYLVQNQGAVMVAKDYRIDLPIFESFLFDWGFEFGDALIKDENASLDDSSVSGSKTNTSLIASYDTDENSYGYAIYKEYADTSSAPRTIFTNTGYVKCSFRESEASTEGGSALTTRRYASFLSSSSAAKAYSKNPITGEYQDLAGYAGKYDLAAIVARDSVDSVKNENTYSYVFCANTADFFSNELLGNPSYANFDIVTSVTENISRLDYFASMDLGGTSLNSSSFGGKQLHYPTLSTEDVEIYSGDASEVIEYNRGITTGFITAFATVVLSFPVIVAVLGIIVCLKRKFL